MLRSRPGAAMAEGRKREKRPTDALSAWTDLRARAFDDFSGSARR